MLVHINVRNIALIDEVSLELHENLNILTGETGAGKSMIIDSINFALGGRVSKSIIRRGEKFAYVELLFDHHSDVTTAKLEEFGIQQEDDCILISRTLYTTGRTLYKINGQTVTRTMLKEISGVLLDVHGQHEHQSLLDPTSHIELLDRFGGKKLAEHLSRLQVVYHEFSQLDVKLKHLMDDDKTRVQMIDILKFQIKEIKDANLIIGEDTTLMEEMKVLGSAEKITSSLQEAYEYLNADNREGVGVTKSLGEAIRAISAISDINEELSQIYKELQNIEVQVWEMIPTLRNLSETIEYDPERLFIIQQRLDLIYKLKRKYGDSVEEILTHYHKISDDLQLLENSDQERTRIKKEMAILEKEMTEICHIISEIRKEQAKKVSIRIEKELHELQMENAKFKIEVNLKSKIGRMGIDDVEFMISTNNGEPMQPLGKIASGGEMSRMMLAIKTILADVDEISTLIFDEIDTGISGRTAQKVAEKLAFIAKKHQVICITHLPQIAAMSDYHYLIEKDSQNTRPNTHVYLLNDKDIVDEISRLMAGTLITSATLESAKEIKSMATTFKKALKA